MVVSAKDQKLTVMMSEEDMNRLRDLSEADEVTASHVVRTLIREAYLARFSAKRVKSKR